MDSHLNVIKDLILYQKRLVGEEYQKRLVGEDPKVFMRVSSGSYSQFYADHPNLINNGSCGDFICKAPHTNWWFGGAMWDVISVKIRRNMKYEESEVRIHGAIRVHTANHFTDYLFKRGKADAQVFENPGELLTLSLVGPHEPWVLDGCSGFNLYAFLKYNDEDIFEMRPDRPPEYYTNQLKGCPERYRDIDDGYWGDFEGCSDLFSGKEDQVDPVGSGLFCVPCISITSLSTDLFHSQDGILDKVASVEVEMAHIYQGMMARLKVTSSRDLDLYGEIIARSCHFENGVVLYHKTQKEAIQGKLTKFSRSLAKWPPSEGTIREKSIELSRSLVAVYSRSSLLIKFCLQDAKDNNFLVDETMQFAVLPKGRVSQKTSNGAISVKVEWTFEHYEGPSFCFPFGEEAFAEAAFGEEDFDVKNMKC